MKKKYFLRYFEESTDEYVENVEDKSIKKLHQKITELKKSREWEAGYMKVEELLEKEKQKGIWIGKQDTIFLLLAEKGDLSQELKEAVESEEDLEKLNVWVKLASKVKNVEEFQINM